MNNPKLIKSKHFRIEELVPKGTFEELGEQAWELIHPDLIEMIDLIKEHFPEGSCTINNWLWNGQRNWSGLRTPDSPYYSKTSQHTLGKAVDMIFNHYTTDYVRDFIIRNIDQFPKIKGIEIGTSWLHIDVRDRKTLLKFSA